LPHSPHRALLAALQRRFLLPGRLVVCYAIKLFVTWLFLPGRFVVGDSGAMHHWVILSAWLARSSAVHCWSLL
jgi:hypothetical protein